jgi:hypothetical protein
LLIVQAFDENARQIAQAEAGDQSNQDNDE